MNVDSIEFKGYSCFEKDWVHFDTIKLINVIVGRNNSGKSQMLDLVEALCDITLFRHTCQYRCYGILDEESLKNVFPVNEMDVIAQMWDTMCIFDDVKHLVDRKVTWEVVPRQSPLSENEYELYVSSIKLSTDSLEPTSDIFSAVELILKDATHQLSETSFYRLFADRDIEAEPEDIKLELGRDGQGATNIIRRFILTSNERFPREVIQEELLTALNLIFGSDGQFSGIQVQVHDDKTDKLKGHWEVCLHEKKKGWIPLSKSGSGLKTVILVLLNLLVIPKIEGKDKSQFTFAFEEFENNLHPALLRRFFQYLEKYVIDEKATIFLTTHSSIALDLFGTSDNAQIIHVSHDGESAHVTTVPTHFGHLKIISELGAKPSDLLQSNGLIWVEGPTDRIYLNYWIELYTQDRPQGSLREGRDYQCVFYGGSLLARVQFTSPEEEASELANLFRINPNFFVMCDGDRETEDSDLKPRVKRIREEVEKIDKERIWITDAKEIENYLPGPVLSEVTELPSLPNPGQYESWLSYTKKHMQGKSIDKVDLAISSTQAQYMTREVMEKQFDWKKHIKKIVECIDSWNENSSSEGL
ncbi:MAG: AAA family ATPase [Gemmatimonadetes bacterium]|nr:AAA family ATPase [Gemmatimonadota bacterium]